jgi:hypothetical protein
MRKITAATMLAVLVSGCTTQLEREAQEDRVTFLQCKAANPTTWGEKCTAEMNMYFQTSAAAQADSAHRAQQANAIATGMLAGAAVAAAGAAAAEASRPVYYVQPVVVCNRWGRCY